MTEVGAWLSHFFATKLYPAVVLGVFLGILYMVVVTVVTATSGWVGTARRLIGAFIPFVALVILVATGTPGLQAIATDLNRLHYSIQFVIGASVGALFMETSHHVLDSDGAAGVFAIFLGTLAAFVLWAVMGGALVLINVALLGLVVGSGLHVVFRGLP